jgi:hypothetical protein
MGNRASRTIRTKSAKIRVHSARRGDTNISVISMNRNKKTGTFILSCLLLLSTQSTGCIAPDCGNEIIRILDSPTKQLKAIVFQRDCGATTGFSTQISIISAKSNLPNESGNVFVADKLPSGPGGGPPVEVEWKGESSLHITYYSGTRVFLRRDSQKGVAITYSEKTF